MATGDDVQHGVLPLQLHLHRACQPVIHHGHVLASELLSHAHLLYSQACTVKPGFYLWLEMSRRLVGKRYANGFSAGMFPSGLLY